MIGVEDQDGSGRGPEWLGWERAIVGVEMGDGSGVRRGRAGWRWATIAVAAGKQRGRGGRWVMS
jgi:hypothetical protein